MLNQKKEISFVIEFYIVKCFTRQIIYIENVLHPTKQSHNGRKWAYLDKRSATIRIV